MAILDHVGQLRSSSLKDDPAYAGLVRANLAFGNVISHCEIPICDFEGHIGLQPWPLILPHDMARVLLQNGRRKYLGAGTAAFWRNMSCHFGVEKPGTEKDEAIGLQLYGDEGEIFKGIQYMALHWSSENSPYFTDARRTKYLIALIPVSRYAMHGKINLTLESIMAVVVRSCNLWFHQGVCGLYGAVTTLKGDWKFLTQVLCLKRTPNTDAFCFLCMGTKSLAVPATDLSQSAQWKVQVPAKPWHQDPEVFHLENFSLGLVGIDVLHCFHLGIGRDVVASCLVILLRTHAFAGSTAPWLIKLFDPYFQSMYMFAINF